MRFCAIGNGEAGCQHSEQGKDSPVDEPPKRLGKVTKVEEGVPKVPFAQADERPPVDQLKGDGTEAPLGERRQKVKKVYGPTT